MINSIRRKLFIRVLINEIPNINIKHPNEAEQQRERRDKIFIVQEAWNPDATGRVYRCNRVFFFIHPV